VERTLPTILIDTREQRPWKFSPEKFQTATATIWAGDYTIAGLEDRIRIERKSLGDLVNTVVHDWIRFRKELNRLAGFDLAVIVVEADVTDLWLKRYESDADPNSVWGRCNSCLIDHGIPVLWWGERSLCEKGAERFLSLAVKKYSLPGVAA
jgi:ERCC4-type nuclease